MAKVECYDPQGNKYMKEPVDARECVEHCGFTMTPPEVEAEVSGNDEGKSKSGKSKKG